MLDCNFLLCAKAETQDLTVCIVCKWKLICDIELDLAKCIGCG